MRLELIRILVAGLFAVASGGQAVASFHQTQVDGLDGRTCWAYVSLPDTDSAAKLPLILIQNGTGLYSTENHAKFDPVATYLLENAQAAILSIDKPGISGAAETAGGFAIDHAQYDKHVQGDLLACTQAAVKWAGETFAARLNDRILLAGHSEGAQVVARLYAKLLAVDPATAAKIAMVQMTGIPMVGWREMVLNLGLTEEESNTFWTAIEQKDDAVLLDFCGLASAYWDDIFATQPLENELLELSKIAPAAAFQFYHGIEDTGTKVEPVLRFEKANLKLSEEGQPALRLSARYYQAGHWLNLAAVNDQILAILAYLKPY